MFDFIKGLFIWLVKKVLFFFFPVVGWIIFFFDNFSSTIKAIWNYFITFFKWYFNDFYLWVFSHLTELLTSFFQGNDFVVSVVELSNDTFCTMNVFLPMNEVCACLTFLLATATAVFLIRLILKAIPTIW